MSIENKNSSHLTERGERAKKIAVKVVGGTAVAITVLVGPQLLQTPHLTGHQTVEIEPGDTVDDLIKEHVDGGASHTGDVRAEVMDDPANADVFVNGQLDPGEVLELPEKVEYPKKYSFTR